MKLAFVSPSDLATFPRMDLESRVTRHIVGAAAAALSSHASAFPARAHLDAAAAPQPEAKKYEITWFPPLLVAAPAREVSVSLSYAEWSS